MGELMLKGRNRCNFEQQLLANLRLRLPQASFHSEHGRVYVSSVDEQDLQLLLGVFGLSKMALAQRSTVSKEQLISQAAAMVGEYLQLNPGQHRFKVNVRRINKSTTLNSYQWCCLLGDALRQRWPQLTVNLNNPDWVLNLEFRGSCWLYLQQWPGLGGLPCGVSGRALLMLSGGIDSVVAGFLMSKRGLSVDMIYFDTPPYTDNLARQKVKKLARLLAFYGNGQQRIAIVPFTELQLQLRQKANKRFLTIFSRAAMVEIASKLAVQQGLQALISGESLAQVASQTISNMSFTASYAQLPLLKPLIGFDKEEIISIARKIGSYPISVEPYDDCCHLFTTDHPILQANLEQSRQQYQRLDLEALLKKTLQQTNWQHVPPPWAEVERHRCHSVAAAHPLELR